MSKPIFLIVAICLSVSIINSAQANNVQLTERVKSELIAAKPVADNGVDRAIFDGKPVLVVFFASW